MFMCAIRKPFSLANFWKNVAGDCRTRISSGCGCWTLLVMARDSDGRHVGTHVIVIDMSVTYAHAQKELSHKFISA